MEARERLSIREITNLLSKEDYDWWFIFPDKYRRCLYSLYLDYCNEEEITFSDLPEELRKTLEEVPTSAFLHYLCANGLSVYKAGVRSPLGVYGGRYLEICSNELQLIRDELKEAIWKEVEPLPKFWFSEEDHKLSLSRCKHRYCLEDLRDKKLDDLRKKRVALQHTKDQTPTDIVNRRAELERYDKQEQNIKEHFAELLKNIDSVTDEETVIEYFGLPPRDRGVSSRPPATLFSDAPAPEMQIGKEPFPCPGADWSQVVITLVDDDMVRIRTPKGTGLYTYHQLKFKDRRHGNKPIAIWETLKLFCRLEGNFSTSELQSYDKELVKNISRLQSHLKDLFGIREKFLPHYKKRSKYESEINFRNETFDQSIYVDFKNQRKRPQHSE